MNDILLRRVLANGRTAEVLPLLFGRARLGVVSQHCRHCYDQVY